jgi:RNA polymerase sigma-70 factor (ECF subfamily)
VAAVAATRQNLASLPDSPPTHGRQRIVPETLDPAADLALVRGVLAGSESARVQFEECLQCVPRILAAHNARLGHPLRRDDLADVVQDVSLLILRKLPGYAGRAPLVGWIYRLCSLELMNAMRRRWRQQRRFANPTAAEEAEDPLADRESTAWIERDRLLRAIERVGGVESDLLVLKHFEDLTFVEIGRLLGLAPSTVKTRYYRGLDQLEQILGMETGASDD